MHIGKLTFIYFLFIYYYYYNTDEAQWLIYKLTYSKQLKEEENISEKTEKNKIKK